MKKAFYVSSNTSLSLSPLLHNILNKYDGLNLDYGLIETNKIEDIISQNFDFKNIGMPFKEKVVPFLNLDEISNSLQAVNTVKYENGKILGTNTDIYGLLKTFELSKLDLNTKNCLILGYGGTAKTITYLLKTLNANVYIDGRNKEKIEDFIRINGGKLFAESITNDIEYIFNTTPLGSYNNIYGMPICLNNFKNVKYVFDCHYSPINTALIKNALKLGLDYDNGLTMLFYQGLKAREFWGGKILSLDEEKKALLEFRIKTLATLLKKEKNIILCGFRNSGKSFIGKLLALELGYKFLDLDDVIYEKYGDIIKNEGLEKFRDAENSTLKSLNLNNTVLALGGGTVLNKINVDFVKQNGVIVYIDTPYDIIAERQKESKKPLIFIDSIENFYFRTLLYKQVCDFAVKFN